MPRIYRSPYADIVIPERSIFTHVFSRGFDLQLPAFVDTPTGTTITRADVRSRSLQLAWALQNTLGQKRASTMAIYSPNSIVWPIVLLGGIAAGMSVTTVNSSYTPPELVHQFHDSRAYHVFVHPSLVANVQAAFKLMNVSDAEAKKRIVLMGPPGDGAQDWNRVDKLLGKGQLKEEVRFDGPAAHETVLLCYSSGTTSKSKGVELTHYNVVSDICMNGPYAHFTHPDGPMMLGVLPFYHIYGLVKLVLNPFYYGCPVAVMAQFDPELFCAYIERYKVTLCMVVPPIIVVLANHPAVEKYNLRSLRILYSGAAPLGAEIVLVVHERLRRLGANVIFSQGWGLTETSPTCTAQLDIEWQSKSGNIGRLVSNVRARLVRDDGTDAPEGEPGEIWVKGPNVMKGYLNNPEATRDAITPDGWFKTGDVAIVDKDSDFKIVDRKKELIKYKGFQVPPAELEATLLTHPNVVDAGVIGVYSDAEATEYPRAYVVPRGGLELFKTEAKREAFEQEVQQWIRGQVARHKYLRGGVVAVNAIPKSAAGKILRRELRDRAKKEWRDTSAKTKL